ncbi:MAG: DinB family protein [Bacteroidales bacterium]|nr:DinB family protein [Bacteroidales bacterium]
MTSQFHDICSELTDLIEKWEAKLAVQPAETVSRRKNNQGRTIRQIVGHMVDSATNNTHRIIHMHYQKSPITYPDYANLGNNDRWIAIQNYQEEDWDELVMLWAAVNRHVVHLIQHANESKLDQYWISALKEKVTLREMISDYPRHFKLHINEISALINQLTINHD